LAARTVTYIFELIDRFAPNAAKLSEAAKKAQQSVHGLANAFDAAEGRGAKFAIAERRRMEELARARETHITQAEKSLHRYEQQSQRFQRAIGTTATAMMTFGLGNQVMKSFDNIMTKASQIPTMREKLRFAGQSQGQIAFAESEAYRLSSVYKNMSAAEVMEIINDARANLTGSFEEVVKHIEPFVKLGGFFKAYDGGSHAGGHKKLLEELNAAMQSGELLGKITPAQLAQHVEQLGRLKVVYGDRLSMKAYLQAQRASAASLMMMDDDFKYGFFPALVQSMSTRAGVGLGTLTNKSVAGIMMKGYSLEFMREIGMIDWAHTKTDKKGNIVPGHFGLKNEDLAGSNPMLWTWRELLPRLAQAKHGIKGLEIGSLRSEFEKALSDPSYGTHHLEELLQKMNQGDLRRLLGKAWADRTGVALSEEFIMQAPKLIKDLHLLKQVRKEFEGFKTYDKAKQTLEAQWMNMVGALGGPVVDFASKRLEKLASVFETIATWARAHPETAKWATNIAMVGAAALTAAAGLGAAVLSLKLMGALLGGGVLGGFMKWGAIGAAGFGLYSLVSHWDAVKAYIERNVPSISGVLDNISLDGLKAKWDALCASMSAEMQKAISESLTGSKLVDDNIEGFFQKLAARMSDAIGSRNTKGNAEGGFHRAGSRDEGPFEGLIESLKYQLAVAAYDIKKFWDAFVDSAREAWKKVKEFFDIGDLFKLPTLEEFKEKWARWARTGSPDRDDSFFLTVRDWKDRKAAPSYLQPGYGSSGYSGVYSSYASTLAEEMGREAARGGWRGGHIYNEEDRRIILGGLPASEAKREIDVKTQVEGAVTVKVDASGVGEGRAIITGTGAAGIRGASRGESAPRSTSGGAAP
jgi:hypothetical protein